MTADPRTTLPFAWYSDPAVLHREHRRIFARHWQYVGHTGQVSEAQTMASVQAGHVPVLLTRDRADTLRAFLNVCRHRGSQLVDGEANRSTIQCPYHAWTYELDGRLRSAPRFEREAGFERGALGLMPLAVERWGPFIFVNPDRDAAPLAETLGELPELVASAGINVDRLHFHTRTSGSYAANWKICCENFLECYHCQVAHPGLTQVIDVAEDAYRLEEAESFSTQFGPVKEGWTGDFNPTGTIRRGQFHFLFPNLTININPGQPNLSIGPVLPRGPERSFRYWDYFFPAESDEAWIRELLEWEDQVGAEDKVLVERVQLGVRSGVLDRGVLLESERLIGHFDRLLTAALDD